MKGTILSKYRLCAVTSGDVTLKFNIVHHSQALIRSNVVSDGGRSGTKANKYSLFLLEWLSAPTLVNSANAVLIAFKRARMLIAREGLDSW
jgi:hypothetical protein